VAGKGIFSDIGRTRTVSPFSSKAKESLNEDPSFWLSGIVDLNRIRCEADVAPCSAKTLREERNRSRTTRLKVEASIFRRF
jgi:hypothetical protein